MRVDAASAVVTATVTGFSGPYGICSDGRGNIWVTNSGGGTVMRVDAASAVVTATVTGFSTPISFGADAGSE
jgi:DNA-binding beta-propeller fold protein YncE